MTDASVGGGAAVGGSGGGSAGSGGVPAGGSGGSSGTTGGSAGVSGSGGSSGATGGSAGVSGSGGSAVGGGGSGGVSTGGTGGTGGVVTGGTGGVVTGGTGGVVTGGTGGVVTGGTGGVVTGGTGGVVTGGSGGTGGVTGGTGGVVTGGTGGTGGTAPCDGSATVTNVTINNTTTTPYSTAPLTALTISADYTLSVPASCSNCRTQLVAGFAMAGYGTVAGSECIADEVPATCPATSSGTTEFKLTAPQHPGNYQIRWRRYNAADCNAARALFEQSFNYTGALIGTVQVNVPACGSLVHLVQNASLNGGGNELTVAPGASVGLTANRALSQLSGCPACIAQIVVGLHGNAGTGLSCLYSGIPTTCPLFTSGNGALTFQAPAAPGVYTVRSKTALEQNCTNAVSNYGAGGAREATFAVLRVQ
ncbi:MAG: hypothetical protein KF718_02985 [Polyangiaceae bacterium]|nr:hypothetical protein [Polyangiaceae bacterium]